MKYFSPFLYVKCALVLLTECIRSMLVLALCFTYPSLLLSLPKAPQVMYGQAKFNRSGSHLNISPSDNAIIRYQGFDINTNESVRFIQSSKHSRVLNHIQSSQASQILGKLEANGQVYLLNSSGIFFGNQAVVDVNALYAVAGDMSYDDFLNKINLFSYLNGNVVNEGMIQANLVALFGKQVINQGSIIAPNGMVSFISADKVLIGEENGNVFIEMERKNPTDDINEAAIIQNGLIDASGGEVYLGAADVLSALGVAHSGETLASVMRFNALNSDVSISGDLFIKNSNQTGGLLSVEAENILISDAYIDASGAFGGGNVFIGGSYQGKGPLKNAKSLFVDDKSIIKANALEEGNGGELILWSDDYTDFSAYIEAKGGAFSGNGGFVEVSGKKELFYHGLVDLRAIKGIPGTLLLDPADIVIDAAYADTLEGQLELGSVVASATNSITVSAPITTTENYYLLTLSADNSIDVNAPMDLNGSLTLDTDGTISITSPISTGLGVIMNAVGLVDIDADIETGSTLSITTEADIDVASDLDIGWSLNLITNENIILDGDVSAQSTVTLRADNDHNNTGDVTIATGKTLLTSNDSASVYATDLILDGSIDLGYGSLVLYPSAQNTGVDQFGLGDVASTGGVFQYDSGEISRTSAGTLFIGGPYNTGNIVLKDVAAGLGSGIKGSTIITTSSSGDINLLASGDSSFNGLTITTVDEVSILSALDLTGTLTISATGDISIPEPIIATGGFTLSTDGIVDIDADLDLGGSLSITTTQAVDVDGAIDAGGSLTVNTEEGIDFAKTVSLGSTLSLLTNESINFDEDVTAVGTVSLIADNDHNNTGDVTLAASKTLSSGNGSVTIYTTDFILDGSLNAGIGNLVLYSSALNTGIDQIGVGNVASTGGVLQYDSAEIARTTAGAFYLGGPYASGNIILNDVNVGSTSNFTGATYITTNTTSGSISVTSGGDSSFNGVSMTSIDSIPIESNLDVDGFLTLISNGDIDINQDITANGVVNIWADNDHNNTGDVSIAASKTVSSGNNSATIYARDFILDGSFLAGDGSLTLYASALNTGLDQIGIGDVAVTGGIMQYSNAEIARTTASSFYVGGSYASGNILFKDVDFSAASTIPGPVYATTHPTDGSISLLPSGDSLFTELSMIAGDDITIESNMDITEGFTLIGGGDVDIDQDIMASGEVNIRADNDHNNTGDVSIATGKTVESDNNPITIYTTDFILDGSLLAGDASLTLFSNALNTGLDQIGVGDVAQTGGIMQFDDAEIARTTATGFNLGGPYASGNIILHDIDFSGAAPITGKTTITTNASLGTIIVDNLGSYFFNQLEMTAGEDISLLSDIDVRAEDFTLTAGRDISVEANIFSVGPGYITADANNNTIGEFYLAATKSITPAPDAALQIIAASYRNEGIIDSGSEDIRIAASAGSAMSLNGTQNFDISSDELNRIYASNLQVGGPSSGSIHVTGVVPADLENVINMVTFDATSDNSQVIFETTESEFDTLTVLADNGIEFRADVSVINGDLILEGDYDNAYDSSDRISFFGPRTLNVSNTLSLDSTYGKIFAFDELNLLSKSDIQINDSIYGYGTININTDSDADGNGDFNLSSGISVYGVNQDVIIEANDINNNGYVYSGSASISLLVSDGADISLGNTATPSDYDISGAELQKFSGANLYLGDENSGNITVGAVTASQSNYITNTVYLNAIGPNKTITFDNGDAVFNGLEARSDMSIAVYSNITADLNSLVFKPDYDDSDDGDDKLSIYGAKSLSAALDLTLDGRNGIEADSALDLSSGRDMFILDDLNVQGELDIHADSNGFGGGNFNLASDKEITSNDFDVVILADDFILDGNLNVGSGNIQLGSSSNGSMALGDADGDFDISKDELARISATGSMLIGGSTTGAIIVDNMQAADRLTLPGELTLEATGNNGQVTFENGASVFNNLKVYADDGIFISADVSTYEGDLVLDGDKDNLSDSLDQIVFAGERTLSSEGSLTLDATSGKMTADNKLTLEAKTGITLHDDLHGLGELEFNADIDLDDSGLFTIASAAKLSTQDKDINLKSANIDIQGSLDAGLADILLYPSNSEDVSLGSLTAAASYHIDNSEFLNIKAYNLKVMGGDFYLKNAEINPELEGAAQFITQGLDNSIEVVSSSGFSSNLELLSNQGISINAKLKGSGDLSLLADYNNNENGTLFIKSGALVSGQNIELQANNLDLKNEVDALKSLNIYASNENPIHIGESKYKFTQEQKNEFGNDLNAKFYINNSLLKKLNTKNSLILGKDNSLIIVEALNRKHSGALELKVHDDYGRILFVGDNLIQQKEFITHGGGRLSMDGNVTLSGKADINAGYFILEDDRDFSVKANTGPLIITAEYIELREYISLNQNKVEYNGILILPEGIDSQEETEESVVTDTFIEPPKRVESLTASNLPGQLSVLAFREFNNKGAASSSVVKILGHDPEAVDYGFSDFEGMEIMPIDQWEEKQEESYKKKAKFSNDQE